MLSVKKSNFIQLFRKGNFSIPTYQRGYVWKKNEWEDFYNDVQNIVELKKYKMNHFMGNILITKKNGGYEIIDGQQRLITTLLFIKAFEAVYSEIKPDLVKERIGKIFENRLDLHDRDDVFTSIINGTFDEFVVTTNKSSKNIKDPFLFFKVKIYNQGRPLFNRRISTDDNLYRMLLKLIFIEVLIKEDSNPYLIFETLNARGVDLNISDLVKNHLIERATDKDFVMRRWEQLTRGLEVNQFEELFQYFYNSSNNKKRLLKEITGEIDSDEKVKEFLQKLSKYTQYYKQFEDITFTYDEQEVQECVSYLNYLGVDLYKIVSIPSRIKFVDELLITPTAREIELFEEEKRTIREKERNFTEEYKNIYRGEHGNLDENFPESLRINLSKYKNRNQKKIKKDYKIFFKSEYQKEFLKILKLLEVFIFRYIVISKKDEKTLRNKFFEIAQKLNSSVITSANEIYSELYKDFFVDDEEFENAFSYIRLTYSKRPEYRHNNQGDQVKYILYRLENHLRNDKLLSLVGTQTNDISIEHIENDSSVTMPDGFKYRLGNYTLMKEADNNQAGANNLDFVGKRDEWYRRSTYLTTIGGRRNNKNLKSLKRFSLWNQDNIKTRQRQMAKLAIDLWSLDGSQFTLDVPND